MMTKFWANRYRGCILTAVLLAMAGYHAVGQPSRTPPPYTVELFPDPPQQRQPWTPPETRLPKVLLSAAVALFESGLADPRGGDYRVIKVRVGSCWSGDAGLLETRGWVLPRANDEKQRFAVCWNGLVYPLISVGAKADMQADVRMVIEADDKARAGRKDFYRSRHATTESASVSHQSMLPIRACLLLRLGEGKLAEQYWAAWTAGMRADTNDDSVHLKDPYLMLATDWAWARFDRGLCAHMRGADQLALLDARALVGMKAAVETEGKNRGLLKGDEREGLYFLSQLPDLLADQERRARAPKREPLPAKAAQARRVAALVRDLENVSARQFGQPGGVDLAWDGVVKALIQEGNAAVEPLLDCLEKDERLTRSVHFHRDFSYHRTVLGVHEAAYVALSGILETSFFGVGSTGDNLTARGKDGRKQVAASVRAYWNRFKDVPLEERWYLTLKNDTVSAGHWLQAAANITRRVDVEVSPGSMFGTGWTTVPDRKAGANPPMRGEVLRMRKEPSVTELMLTRMESLRQSGGTDSERRDGIKQACQMILHLAEWDLKAAAPELKILVRTCRSFLTEEKRGDGWNFSYLGPALATLTQWRLRAGDAEALNDYAVWIRTVQPSDANHSFENVLAPLWQNPDHPAIAAAAESLFNNDTSPWTKMLLRRGNTHDLFQTPMLGLTGLRKRIQVELTDRGIAGKVKLDGKHGWLEVFGGYSGGAAIHYDGDPLAPPAGTKEAPFRVCDYNAWELSRLDGFPRCELYWPVAERDKAVADCSAFLAKFGERLKYSSLSDARQTWPGRDRARLAFPHLDRPATTEEARDGLAIFVIASDKKVRTWKMPTFPLKARWFTLKDYPYEVQFYDTKAKKGGVRTEYHQAGFIWQAEEVLQDGKWQRYYGFSGRYVLNKVPAEQMEFPAPDTNWAELAGGVDCRLASPERVVHDKGTTTWKLLRVREPLVLRVQLRNRAGLEKLVPTEFVRNDPKGPALHVGIQPRLFHAKAKADVNEDAEEREDWKELTRKAIASFRPGSAAKPAVPGETFAEFEIDLTRWFDITQAGAYRVQLDFSNRDGGLAIGSSHEIRFQLAKGRN